MKYNTTGYTILPSLKNGNKKNTKIKAKKKLKKKQTQNYQKFQSDTINIPAERRQLDVRQVDKEIKRIENLLTSRSILGKRCIATIIKP